MFQVGTGFSFTKDDAGFATNEVDVARDLYRYLLIMQNHQNVIHAHGFKLWLYISFLHINCHE